MGKNERKRRAVAYGASAECSTKRGTAHTKGEGMDERQRWRLHAWMDEPQKESVEYRSLFLWHWPSQVLFARWLVLRPSAFPGFRFPWGI